MITFTLRSAHFRSDLFIPASDAGAASLGFAIAQWSNSGSANLEEFTATAISSAHGGPVELVDSLQDGRALPEPATSRFSQQVSQPQGFGDAVAGYSSTK